jgi:hypothetical protein
MQGTACRAHVYFEMSAFSRTPSIKMLQRVKEMTDTLPSREDASVRSIRSDKPQDAIGAQLSTCCPRTLQLFPR